ncbi:hypothetical protein L3Q82_000722 [Scortum barcoo]|uniref:Uncharacterized protein n=1 Tax=Scortum barcoo TaxID=214431 RepID=A0ACB8WDU1_9TELE|nr:hypothetical protein L3Q82_000722 [Scortum barcoo]
MVAGIKTTACITGIVNLVRQCPHAYWEVFQAPGGGPGEDPGHAGDYWPFSTSTYSAFGWLGSPTARLDSTQFRSFSITIEYQYHLSVGGGSFGDPDLLDVSGIDYKPDGGRSGGGGAVDPGYDPQGGFGFNLGGALRPAFNTVIPDKPDTEAPQPVDYPHRCAIGSETSSPTGLRCDCSAIHSTNTIVKFADDTTIVGLISDNDETHYREEIQQLTQ